MDAVHAARLKKGAIAAALAAVFLAIVGLGFGVQREFVLATKPVDSGAHAQTTAGAADPPAEGASPMAGAATIAAGPAATGLAGGAIDAKTFRVDAAGQLVLDETTRLNVEALVALTPPDQLRAAAQAQVEGLSAAAAAAALDLVERYSGYQAAQKLAYAPGGAPLVPEEALAELDGLHALRVSYFGPGTAQSLFADEERMARKLLEFMRADTTPGLTMEQRATRAQASYDAWQASAPAGTRSR